MTWPIRPVAPGSETLDVTTGTNLFCGRGTAYRVVVAVTANAVSKIIDSTDVIASAGNTILSIPPNTAVGTVYVLNWPCIQGLSVVPGTGVTLSVTSASQGIEATGEFLLEAGNFVLLEDGEIMETEF